MAKAGRMPAGGARNTLPAPDDAGLKKVAGVRNQTTRPRARVRPEKSPGISRERIEAVIEAAGESGLLTNKSARISGRISPALVKEAKRQTGIQTDTELIEFALASIALKDDFAEAFCKLHGTVDPSLDLEF